MAQERILATLARGFGTLALVLACVGLYGLFHYSVVRSAARDRHPYGTGRAPERRDRNGNAAGADVGRGSNHAGATGVWIASRWIKSLLFGLTATDPATIAGVALLRMTAALRVCIYAGASGVANRSDDGVARGMMACGRRPTERDQKTYPAFRPIWGPPHVNWTI